MTTAADYSNPIPCLPILENETKALWTIRGQEPYNDYIYIICIYIYIYYLYMYIYIYIFIIYIYIYEYM